MIQIQNITATVLNMMIKRNDHDLDGSSDDEVDEAHDGFSF